jgi:hypothetical protein
MNIPPVIALFVAQPDRPLGIEQRLGRAGKQKICRRCRPAVTPIVIGMRTAGMHLEMTMTAAAPALLSPTQEALTSSGVGLVGRIVRMLAGLRELAPYAAIELVLPGGSLLALLLWLYRRRKSAKLEMRSKELAI